MQVSDDVNEEILKHFSSLIPTVFALHFTPPRCLSFTDDMFKDRYNHYLPKCLPKCPDEYESNESPRFFWNPEEVWEIKGADLTRSPVHTAGIGCFEDDIGIGDDGDEEERGVGLRFPRFVRVRPDKKPHQATTAREIVRMYKEQFK